MYSYFLKTDKKLIKEMARINNPACIDIPSKYLSIFSRVAGCAEMTYIFKKYFLKSPLTENLGGVKALIIGLHGGRDYWSLKALGYEVYGMDINSYSFPNSVVANAEDRYPYEDNFFDVIIIGEVLEHLFFDKECLLEANRVLNNNGRLIVTVPYHDSNDDFHVRMHDFTTISHLAYYSNFRVVDSVERPGIFFKPYLNYINGVVAVLIYSIFKVNIYPKLVLIFGEMEYFFGKKNILRKVLKSMNLINYGGAILLTKSDNEGDDKHLKSNIEFFQEG